MKYEIDKKLFDHVIFELIYFNELFRLNGHVDRDSMKLLQSTIDTLRYYRQFAKD